MLRVACENTASTPLRPVLPPPAIQSSLGAVGADFPVWLQGGKWAYAAVTTSSPWNPFLPPFPGTLPVGSRDPAVWLPAFTKESSSEMGPSRAGALLRAWSREGAGHIVSSISKAVLSALIKLLWNFTKKATLLWVVQQGHPSLLPQVRKMKKRLHSRDNSRLQVWIFLTGTHLLWAPHWVSMCRL